LLGENEGDYWNNTSVNTYQTEEDTEYALRKLLEFNRPSAAIEGLSIDWFLSFSWIGQLNKLTEKIRVRS
jgi:hypothetical protein